MYSHVADRVTWFVSWGGRSYCGTLEVFLLTVLFGRLAGSCAVSGGHLRGGSGAAAGWHPSGGQCCPGGLWSKRTQHPGCSCQASRRLVCPHGLLVMLSLHHTTDNFMLVVCYGSHRKACLLFLHECVKTWHLWCLVCRWVNVCFYWRLLKLFFFFCPSGKVHGSLARAGKVRGQTPKVCLELCSFSCKLAVYK